MQTIEPEFKFVQVPPSKLGEYIGQRINFSQSYLSYISYQPIEIKPKDPKRNIKNKNNKKNS